MLCEIGTMGLLPCSCVSQTPQFEDSGAFPVPCLWWAMLCPSFLTGVNPWGGNDVNPSHVIGVKLWGGSDVNPSHVNDVNPWEGIDVNSQHLDHGRHWMWVPQIRLHVLQ